jgi:protein Mpv17
MRACALALCIAVPLVGAAAGASAEGYDARVDFRIAPVRHVDLPGHEEVQRERADEAVLAGIQVDSESWRNSWMVAPMWPFDVLNNNVRKHPVAYSVAITGIKAGLADLLVQVYGSAKERVSARRLATFVLTGAVYQGLFQYWLFNVVFVSWFPGDTLRATAQKVLAANLLADPLCFFPFFYILNEALSRAPGQVFRVATVSAALGKYYQNCLFDWRNSWCIWLPGHAVTYGVMPPHLRMPWIATVSFGYISLLSLTRGEKPTLPPSKPTGA